jgi:hypothetical protein
MCRPEKGRQIDAIRSRAVRSLQSALRTKYYEIRASLRISRQKAGQFLCSLDLLAERKGFEPHVSNASLEETRFRNGKTLTMNPVMALGMK